MELRIKLTEEAKLLGLEIPKYETKYSAGVDIRACIAKSITINPGETVLINAGFSMEITDNNAVALIYARSGLGIKHGLVPSNCVGVIDSDYRGEVKVGLYNHSDKAFTINPGDRIAQMVLTPIIKADIVTCNELSVTDRGSGGFGSTGVN